MKVRLSVLLTARSTADADGLLEAMRFVVAETRLTEGCSECSTWVDPNLTVHYGAAWVSEAAVRNHLNSPLFTSLLAVVESQSVAPRLQFDFVSHSRGLDYVAEVRGQRLE